MEWLLNIQQAAKNMQGVVGGSCIMVAHQCSIASFLFFLSILVLLILCFSAEFQSPLFSPLLPFSFVVMTGFLHKTTPMVIFVTF